MRGRTAADNKIGNQKSPIASPSPQPSPPGEHGAIAGLQSLSYFRSVEVGPTPAGSVAVDPAGGTAGCSSNSSSDCDFVDS